MDMSDQDVIKKPWDSRGNRLINYANCGNPRARLLPTEEILLSWQSGDQSARIQTALDNLRAHQILKLADGLWRLNKPIIIRKSNIGLKGSGNTILKATWTRQDPIIEINGGSWILNKAPKIDVIQNVPVGTRELNLSSISGLSSGCNIIVERYSNWAYIDGLKCREFGWEPEDYTFKMDRIIKLISGNTIVLDDDVVVEISGAFGGASIYKYTDNRIYNISITNLFLTSVSTNEMDEAHAKIGINIRNARHISIKNIKTEVVQSLVYVDYSARFCHIFGCVSDKPRSTLEGERRYTFYINGSNCLVENCRAIYGRHSFVSGARAMGPNVFYTCKALNEQNDSGPHHRHSAGFLYDNVDANIRVQHRGSSGSGHGVAGVWHTLWNTGLTNKVALQSFGATALNYGVGISNNNDIFMYPDGGEEFVKTISRGGRVEPDSLFKYQQSEQI